MVRFLLIMSLIVYVLYKLGVFRIFMSNQVGGPNQGRTFNRRPPDSNVNVNSASSKNKKGSDFKGGEYVDYEEVK